MRQVPRSYVRVLGREESILQGVQAEPYYRQRGVTIYHADCMTILPHLPDNSFDLVLTDPPYNAGELGKGARGFADKMLDEAYEEWCADWYRHCRRVSRRMILFPGHGSFRMWMRCTEPSGVGCWHKPGNPSGGGAFQFCNWEPFLVYGGRMGGSDVIRAPVTRQRGLGEHPTPKPLRLFHEIIRRTKAASVLDPFLGSGTTTEAASILGASAVGIEIDEGYCRMSVGRLSRVPLVEF